MNLINSCKDTRSARIFPRVGRFSKLKAVGSAMFCLASLLFISSEVSAQDTPSTASAGTATNFTVTAVDANNNTVTGYAGPVKFTSTDTSAVLPANSSLTNGTITFPVTFETAGSQTITATDISNESITGTSSAITVTPSTPTQFSVTPSPSTEQVGTAVNFTVTALDAYNNAVGSYSGTVSFTSTPSGAVFSPASSTLNSGTGTFSATFNSFQNWTITATDSANQLGGTSGSIAVLPLNTSLSPYQPSGWTDMIVVTTTQGSFTDSTTIHSTDNLYVDFAVYNSGPDSITEPFNTGLFVDGVQMVLGFTSSMSPNFPRYWPSQSIGSLSPGTHTLIILADQYGTLAALGVNGTNNSYSKVITVLPPAVNGSCSAANNQSFTSAPASNLCSSGTASPMTGSGPWNWTCAGSDGGTTANCSANLAAGSGATPVPATGLLGFLAVAVGLGGYLGLRRRS